MRLVKEGRSFSTNDADVIRAYKMAGYVEEKVEPKAQPKPTKKATK